jgi:FkbM family methyltransferase
MKFNFKVIIIISVILLLVFSQYGKPTGFNNSTNLNKYIINIDNIYLPKELQNTKNKLKWISPDLTFVKQNFPNTIDWESKIKQDIINNGLKLPKNYCIIDSGAHIGDGAIPIAHALSIYNRNDIKVIAIEPSINKCNFIKKVIQLNNITNLQVINCGLSNKNKILFENQLPIWWKITNNTGATTYSEQKTLYDKFIETIFNTNNNQIKCKSIDSLYSNNIINNPIGIIHLDIEGFEPEALDGAKNIIKKFKPYLSIEDNNNKLNSQINLPKKYRNIKNIGNNKIYKY